MADILGLHGFNKSDGTNKLIAFFNGDAHVYNTGTLVWDAQNQYLNNTDKVECASFLDATFAVSLNTPTRNYSGSAWSIATNVTSAPQGKFIKPYKDRLYIANLSISGTLHPSWVCFSSIPSSAGAITWDTTNDYFEVKTDNGDVITGLSEVANRLVIFKEASMYRWDAYQLQTVSNSIGCTSHRSIGNIRSSIIWLGLEGFYLSNGDEPKIISNAVEPYVKAMTAANYAVAVAWVEGNHYLCYVGTLTDASQDISITNAVFDYDFSNSAFTIHSLPDSITVSTKWKLSNVWSNYLGNSGGKVYKWATGNTDAATTSAGTTIPLEIETIDYFGNTPTRLKTFQKSFVYSSLGSNLTVSHKIIGQPNYEDTDWISDGSARGRSTPVDLDTDRSVGRAIRLKFSEANSGEPTTLEGYSVPYVIGDEL